MMWKRELTIENPEEGKNEFTYTLSDFKQFIRL